MTAYYKNPWFNSSHGHDPAIYQTDAKPVLRDGCLIYNRIPSSGGPGSGRGCWDIVLNGVCIYQMAGPNPARIGPFGWHKTAVEGGTDEMMSWLEEIGAVDRESRPEEFQQIRKLVDQRFKEGELENRINEGRPISQHWQEIHRSVIC